MWKSLTGTTPILGTDSMPTTPSLCRALDQATTFHPGPQNCSWKLFKELFQAKNRRGLSCPHSSTQILQHCEFYCKDEIFTFYCKAPVIITAYKKSDLTNLSIFH